MDNISLGSVHSNITSHCVSSFWGDYRIDFPLSKVAKFSVSPPEGCVATMSEGGGNKWSFENGVKINSWSSFKERVACYSFAWGRL